MLECLEGMHRQGYLHRDVKPANFVRRRKGGRDFVVIDFGLAKQYRAPGGELRPERPKAEFRGTSMYASLGAHEELDQSRRDDLWSLLYVFLDLYLGKLPWAELVRARDKPAVASMKRRYFNGDASYTENLNVNIHTSVAFKMLKEVKWADEPDYKLLRGVFQDIHEGLSQEEKDEEEAFLWDTPPPPPGPPPP
ncbi:unnamed protein product, partial [Discosporangium mesarthrocarpum]